MRNLEEIQKREPKRWKTVATCSGAHLRFACCRSWRLPEARCTRLRKCLVLPPDRVEFQPKVDSNRGMQWAQAGAVWGPVQPEHWRELAAEAQSHAPRALTLPGRPMENQWASGIWSMLYLGRALAQKREKQVQARQDDWTGEPMDSLQATGPEAESSVRSEEATPRAPRHLPSCVRAETLGHLAEMLFPRNHRQQPHRRRDEATQSRPREPHVATARQPFEEPNECRRRLRPVALGKPAPSWAVRSLDSFLYHRTATRAERFVQKMSYLLGRLAITTDCRCNLSEWRDQHLPVLGAIGRPDDTPIFHDFYDFCRTVVADGHIALQPGRRTSLGFRDNADGLVKSRVDFFRVGLSRRLVIASLQYGLVVLWGALRPQVVSQSRHFVFADEWALHSARFIAAC